MQKFSFTTDEGNRIIRHNLAPEMLIQIIINDDDEYSIWGDCFELFEFRGNKIIVKWLADEDELEEIEDYTHIRSILRRAWQWYKSQVNIEKKEPEIPPVETARYHLSFHLSKEQGKSRWELTDKLFNIRITWPQSKFNEEQKIEMLENYDHDNDIQLHTLMRQAAEWLMQHHKEKL